MSPAEVMQSELATINVRMAQLTQTGLHRTRESESELSALRDRRAQLLAASATATGPAVDPRQAELAAVAAELGAINHKLGLMSASNPLTQAGIQREAEMLRVYTERKEALARRRAELEGQITTPVPPQPAPVTGQGLSPADFPRAVTASGALSRNVADAAIAGADIRTLTSPEALRDGRYAASREEIHLRTFGRVLGRDTTEEVVRNGRWAHERERTLAQVAQGHVPAGGFRVATARLPAPRPSTMYVPHGNPMTGPMSPQLAAKLIRNGKKVGL